MTRRTATQFSQVVQFLGSALGPDYEITLYDLESADNPLISIANGRISGQTIGSPMPDPLQATLSGSGSEEDFMLHTTERLQINGKIIRSSAMLIRDDHGKVVGLLGINFDDSRYLELCHTLLELIHPDAFVARQYDALQQDTRLSASRENGSQEHMESLHNDVSSMVQEIFSHTVEHLTVPLERLTQEERIAVITQLAQQGMFRLKGSVQYAAHQLSCSTASIYRYLSKIKRSKS